MSENASSNQKRLREAESVDAPASKKSSNEVAEFTREQWLQKLQALERDNSALKRDVSALQSDNSALQSDNSALKRERKNRSLESLLAVEEGKFKLRRGGEPFSHVNGDHQAAEAKEVEWQLHDPNTEKLKSSTCASRLLQEFVDQSNVDGPDLKFETKIFNGEADICAFVRCALLDAITILEEEGDLFSIGELTTKMERSLFGCRPDMMVVRDGDGVGFLAVKVKQPLLQEKKLANCAKVLGHAFDHAHAMDAFGQGTGLVLITTFEESILCSLNELDFKEQQHNAIVHRTQYVQSGERTPRMQSQSPPILKSPPHHREQISHNVSLGGPSSSEASGGTSVLSSKNSSLTGDDRDENVFKSSFTKGADERLLYRSKSYPSHQLVMLACSALRLAKKSYQKSTRTISKLAPNKIYCFPKVLRLAEENLEKSKPGREKYFWGELHVKLDGEIKSQNYKIGDNALRRSSASTAIDSNDKTSYYIIGCLGHGATSNVYHALDWRGKQVALKVYVKNVDDNNDMMTQEDVDKKAKEATEREAKNLKEFYPSFQDDVGVVRIFGRWCVKMPLFEPVAKGKRRATLLEIEKVLKNTFQKHCKKYEDSDIHWRHVGKYNEECILYDLSDLETDTEKSFVKNHLRVFQNRVSDEADEKKRILNATEL